MRSVDRRVVITGLGVVSPIGSDPTSLWDALRAGRSGVGPITTLPAGSTPLPFAAEVASFQGTIDNFGPLKKEQAKAIRKGLKVMCRECQMGVAASQLAIADAAVLDGHHAPERIGISFGTDYMITLPEDFSEGIRECLDEAGNFQFDRWATNGMPKMSPLWLLKYLPNMPASHLAIYNDLQGPNNSLTLREAAPNVAITEAFQIIRGGRADAMVVGATGAKLQPMKIVHAMQQEELAGGDVPPAEAMRPFDKNRMGTVLGEGAGAVVLEELSAAQARGATIYAEVLGGASSSAVSPNLTARRDKAMANALAATLRLTETTADDVGFVNAHGLSTRASDAEEAWAIQQVLGDRSKPAPVVAPKSHFGNLGAGSGMIELIAGVLALGRKQLFTVLNYRTPDPDCPLAIVTDGDVDPGRSFLNLNATPQGQAAAVLVGRYDG
jgi:3-oxoacyl-[acyl-carrier-protein] synthase II